MSDKIKQLAGQALMSSIVHDEMYRPEGYAHAVSKQFADKFAELFLNEVTQYLFEQSERMQEMASEEPSYILADQHEACADACIDLIAGLQKHFGVQ